jgi:hypothetical protein
MRNTLALLLTAIACSAQQTNWIAILTPENGGTKTRISWELSTFDYLVFAGDGPATHSGASFFGGTTDTGAAFNTIPSPASFSLTTDIVFTNLNNSQSVTADTLEFWLANVGGGNSAALVGIISSNTMAVANGNTIRVTGSPSGTFVFDVDFSHFNAGIWSGGPSSLTITGTPIPEPSTYGLILGGLALAGTAVRRRMKKQAA